MISPRIDTITWHERPRPFAADPVATIALDAAGWARMGARFAPFEDELGGMARRATGSATAAGATVPFGVLDHGEDTTFLVLAPGSASVAFLLSALSEAGLPQEDVLETLPAAPPRPPAAPSSPARTN